MFGFLCFIILAVVLLMQDSFVHPLRLYTFFYCMESRVLVLLVSHSLAGVGDRPFQAQ